LFINCFFQTSPVIAKSGAQDESGVQDESGAQDDAPQNNTGISNNSRAQDDSAENDSGVWNKSVAPEDEIFAQTDPSVLIIRDKLQEKYDLGEKAFLRFHYKLLTRNF
jgi:hypothetical protein